MKKGLFLISGLTILCAMLLLPATSFAATTAGTTQSHWVHPFSAKNHGRSNGNTAQAIPNSGVGSDAIVYNGGPVMADVVNVYALFWEPTGNVSPNYNNLIKHFFADVDTQILGQYTQSDGSYPGSVTLAGSWVDTNPYPTTSGIPGILLDSDIQNEVTQQAAKGLTPGVSNIFFVFLEKNEGLCAGAGKAVFAFCTPDRPGDGSFCAYHSFFNTNTVYAALPYAANPSFNGACTTGASPNNDDADQTINMTSQELMGAATDPLGTGWHDSNYHEISDKCAWSFGPALVGSHGADVQWGDEVTYNGYDNFLIQQEWNNSVNHCALRFHPTAGYYQITNANSKLALDVAAASTSRGAEAIQSTSHGNSTHQQWFLVPDGIYYQLEDLHSALVLDVTAASTSSGAKIIQATNQNTLSQQWQLVPDGDYDVIRNVNSGLVLDIAGGSVSSGAQVIQATSGSSASQQWNLAPISLTFEFKSIKSGQVLTVSGASQSAGAHLIQMPYHGGFSQQWEMLPDGLSSKNGAPVYQFMNARSGLVMGTLNASTSPGALVVQGTNHNGQSQQWQVVPDGNGRLLIKNVKSGLVLGTLNASTSTGAQIIVGTNHNGLSQQWWLALIPA